MKKLIIYGDSILRGVTYSEARGAHTLCRGHKLERVSELGLDVKNRSRMGATITKGLDILESTLDECDGNSIVLFEYGGNDCDFDWSKIAENPEGSFLPHTPEDKFIKEYCEAIETVISKGATPVVSTLVPVDSERYIKWITRKASYENIMSWLGDTSMLHRWQERYNRIVEHISRRFGCAVLDLRERFLSSHQYKKLMSTDGIHPTEMGHDLIEEELCRCLKVHTC